MPRAMRVLAHALARAGFEAAIAQVLQHLVQLADGAIGAGFPPASGGGADHLPVGVFVQAQLLAGDVDLGGGFLAVIASHDWPPLSIATCSDPLTPL